MAPKGRGRKKAEVVEEKLEVNDAVVGDGIKAIKVAKVTKASKKVAAIEEKVKDSNIEANGSGEPLENTEAEEEQIETASISDAPANSKVTSKRGRPPKKRGKEENEDMEETSKVEEEAKPKEVPAKRGRKPKVQNGVDPTKDQENHDLKTDDEPKEEDEEMVETSKVEEEEAKQKVPAKRGRKPKVQNGVDPTKDQENHDSKTDDEAKNEPRSRRKVKVDVETLHSVEEQDETEPKETKAKTTKKGKMQSKEGSVEKEVPSKGPGRKRKNAAEKPESKKVKEDKLPEIDENRELRVALQRNQAWDDMAREQREADGVEEPKVKNVKGPAKGKGKREAKNEGEDSQPSKKAKENTSKSKGAPKKEKDKIPDVTAQDFNNESKTKDGKPWNLKIATWNVNGIRAWLEKNGMSYLHHEKPDIMCIQETKCSDDKLPPEVNVKGYHCYWLAGDKEGYSGVGLLSKEKPISVQYGINVEKHDNEGRVITAEYGEFYLVTSYIPNAGRNLVRLDYRQEWDKDFRSYLKKLDGEKPVVLCGDLNVAHEEIDLANPKTNKKNAGFSKEERDGFSTLLSEGFVDTFRHFYPDQKGAYTFWTYMSNARAKDVGWRLDYFVVSERFVDHLCDSIIRKDVLGSDHCPIALFLHV